MVGLYRVQQVNSLADQGVFSKYPHFVRQILAGTLPQSRLADLSPGYLWTLVTAVGPFGLGWNHIRNTQVLTVAAVALIVGLVAWRLRGPLAGTIGLAVVLLNRSALVNAAELEPESLILLLNTLGLATLFLARRRCGYFAAGLAFGFSVVTRPTAAPAVVAALLVRAFLHSNDDHNRSTSRKWLLTAAFLGLAIPVVAVTSLSRVLLPSPTIMNPGTVFYEGWNPSTTGYSGNAPRLVKEIEATIDEPDALHSAYRIVASAALGDSSDPRTANRFWLLQAARFISDQPVFALGLAGRKLVLACSSWEPYDLATMVRRDLELRSWWWIPFGILCPLAMVGVFEKRDRSVTLPVGAYCVAYLAIMCSFYVTARMRNPVLPAVALLAALFLDRIVRGTGNRADRPWVLLLVAAAAMIPLNRDGRLQLEDRYTWTARFAAARAGQLAQRAAEEGDHGQELRWRVERATLTGQVGNLPSSVVLRDIRQRLRGDLPPRRRFDLARLAIDAHDLDLADRLLGRLQDEHYRPARGAGIPASVHYQRARTAVIEGDWRVASSRLGQALDEAPGDVDALALARVVAEALGVADIESSRFESTALRYHDPATVGLARVTALFDSARADDGRRLIGLLHELYPTLAPVLERPEDTRPRSGATDRTGAAHLKE